MLNTAAMQQCPCVDVAHKELLNRHDSLGALSDCHPA